MKSQKVDPKASLRETEWVFKKNIVPDWQVRFCVNYEYARESEESKLGVKGLREQKALRRGEPWDLMR